MASQHGPSDIAATWLTSYAAALDSGDAQAVAAAFLPYGWLRDVLTFTWDTRSLEGPTRIAAFLSDKLAATSVSNIQLDNDSNFQPAYFTAGPSNGIQFGFHYETPIAFGRGLVQLLPDADSPAGSAWKALFIAMLVVDLKSHEEKQGRNALDSIPKGQTWNDYRTAYVSEVETNPYVLVGERKS